MSKEQFELNKAEIEAIPDENVKTPNMPVSTFLQESEDLYEWCQDDKEGLVKKSLEWGKVEKLPDLTGALRYAQSVWQKDYKSLEAVQTEWDKESIVGFDLRDVLVHHCLFAYRKNPDLLAQTQKIAEGSGNADMIQDLSDLAVLGKANPDPLVKINVDMNLFDQAAEKSETLGKLLAKSNGTKNSDNALKITRDKAYTAVKEIVDEIRLCGKYAFWRTPAREKGYASKYFQMMNNKPKKKSEETTTK
jgi:hypothetical protein